MGGNEMAAVVNKIRCAFGLYWNKRSETEKMVIVSLIPIFYGAFLIIKSINN